MRMDRRSFLRGLVGTAAGVLVAPEVLAEPERRVWALDNTMVRPVHDMSAHIRLLPEWIERLEPHDTPLLDMIEVSDYDYVQRFHWGWGRKPEYIQMGREVVEIAGPATPHPMRASQLIPVYRGRQ